MRLGGNFLIANSKSIGVIDNLTTNSATEALSANQGKILSDNLILKADRDYVDSQDLTLQNQINLKADLSNVYTKSEIDAINQSGIEFKVQVDTFANLPTTVYANGIFVGDGDLAYVKTTTGIINKKYAGVYIYASNAWTSSTDYDSIVQAILQKANQTDLDAINANLSNEIIARQNADTALQTQINSKVNLSTFASDVIASLLTGFSVATTRTAIVATDTILTAFNKIQKYFNDLSTVAFSGSYKDLTNQPFVVGDYKQSTQTANHGSWLLCQGGAVSRTTYASLYALIGTSFGSGDGSTTFNLPDFRGRVYGAIGSGSGLTTRALGALAGEESHTLTVSEIPSHGHRLYRTTSQASGEFANPNRYDVLVGDRGGVYANQDGGPAPFIESTGGGAAHQNMQPTLFGGNVFIFTGL